MTVGILRLALLLVMSLCRPYRLPPLPAVDRYAAMYQVDPRVIRAMVWVESNDYPHVVGSSGERGYMQIMETTAEHIANSIGLDATLILSDPDTNIRAGTWYFSLWYHRFGDLDLALAAYNAGPSHVIACGCVPPFAERYVYKVRQVLGWNWPAEICLDGGRACLMEVP